MAEKDSYWTAYTEFRSRNNYNDVFSATLSKFSGEVNLASVKSCLMIGPGEGQYEIQFIKQFAANVSKIIAVEPDHESAERLRARLEKSLPGVDSQVIETNIESWKGPEDPVDLVLMMLVLHHFGNERKELLKKLHEQWLTGGGHAVVVRLSRTRSPGNMFEILKHLGVPTTKFENIEGDLMEAGFIKQHAHEMQCVHDLSNVDETLRDFGQYFADKPITLDDVRSTVEELFPSGETDQLFYMFAVYQKA